MKRMLFALTLLLIVGIFPAMAQVGGSNTVQFNGFGFSFDSALATNANISQYPGDSPDVQQPGGPEPRYLQFNLYNAGQTPPEAAFDAPISARVYAIADLAAYPDSLAQATALQNLVTQRPDLSPYMVVPSDGTTGTS